MAAHASPEPNASIFPAEPVHYVVKPLTRFLHIEAASGVVLLLFAITALVLANSPYSEAFLNFWQMHIGLDVGEYHLSHSLKHWINDGLMVIFFFVIGLEVKRELVLGGLRELRQAALPVAAALGGMFIPAGIYLALLWNHEGQRGWGIPMATDIAFVVGCMAILGSRVPGPLRVLLLSLAIVDDIGAILVIALGYTESVQMSWLGFGFGGIAVVWLMQRLGVRSMGMYTILGILIWVGFHESGIHATIAGVILGLMTPARPYLASSVGGKLVDRASQLFHGDEWAVQPHRAERILEHQQIVRETVSPLAYLIYVLHPWVAFLIMPLFAIANAGVVIEVSDLFSQVAIATMLGLVIGKPAGILLFSFVALRLKIAQQPDKVSWPQLIGGGFLAGIGFTMALFISALALQGELLRSAKVGVLAGSLISAVIGMVILGTAPRTESISQAEFVPEREEPVT